MRILILGVTGMLGSTFFRLLLDDESHQVYGTMRKEDGLRYFPSKDKDRIVTNINVLYQNALESVFDQVKPDVVINCIGIIKQRKESIDPLLTLPINSLLPHRLQRLCSFINARLVHVSTDCVFSGTKGMYTEQDLPDAQDLYGRSKLIGELYDFKNTITLRTSIIGHELNSKNSLMDWFLSKNEVALGYKNAVFSGLTTVELVKVVREFVLVNPNIYGLYHVSSTPIDKMSLLKLIADIYRKDIKVIPDDQVCIDRSLDSSRFREEAGYIGPSWPEMIRAMYLDRQIMFL